MTAIILSRVSNG